MSLENAGSKEPMFLCSLYLKTCASKNFLELFWQEKNKNERLKIMRSLL